MRDVKEIPFPLTCLSCVALTPYMHKPEQVFGETAEAEYADVFILCRASATIGPFERLRDLTYSLACDSSWSVLSI